MQNSLFDIPEQQNDDNKIKVEECLRFYKIMNYPVPKHYQYFLYEKKINFTQKKSLSDFIDYQNDFSRKEKNPLLDDYINYINKFWWLYRSLPFVKEIYLCNSITFNALKNDSDIDLFIVTKNDRLRLARFFSVLMFSILWLKRSLKKKNKKFCLSFYIIQDAKNLYSISLPKVDIYLTYWLVHLVPLYFEDGINNKIFTENKWINNILPNFPKKFIINIWNKIFYWKTKIKKILEFIFWWPIWFISQLLTKIIRLPIVIKKKNKLWDKWWGILINNHMLKFHNDKRKKIHLLFKVSSFEAKK